MDAWVHTSRYHLECIGLSEDRMARIQAYFCEPCRGANPELKIKFKKARRPSKVGSRELSPAPSPPPPPAPPPMPECSSQGCAKPCEPPSKYCCRPCGVQEAERRLDLLLKRETPPTKEEDAVFRADVDDLTEISKIETHCTEVKSRLEELELLRSRLAKSVARAEATELPETAKLTKAPRLDAVATIDCFSCHNEFPLSKAQGGIILHLHKCHLKLEAEVMVTQPEPTEVKDCPVRSFCNVYDKTSQTYCSRFYAICPKHGPTAKFTLGRAGVVCGYPLQMDDPDSTTMCVTEQRQCLVHAGWAKLHGARLDLETVQQCMYRVYLQEKQALVEQRLNRRHTVLSQVAHSATEHSTEEATALTAAAVIEATRVRAKLDAQSTSCATAAKKSNELTGGSLGLPQRHWR
jgi:hypothetical protein